MRKVETSGLVAQHLGLSPGQCSTPQTSKASGRTFHGPGWKNRQQEALECPIRTPALHPDIVPYWLCGLGPVASQIPHLSNGNLNVYEDDSDDHSLTAML